MSGTIKNRIGKFTEIAWWAFHLLPFARHQWMQDALSEKTRKACFPLFLLPYIKRIRLNNKKVKVIDVGCGPLSPLAWGAESDLIDLIAIDPLAGVYKKLLYTYGIRYPVNMSTGSAENLHNYFQPETFDIAYSRNALDHAIDPCQCLRNISTVLKEKSHFFLEGFTKEGTKQNWKGLHKHDFIVQAAGLIWSNSRGQSKNITQNARLELIYRDKKEYDVGDWFRAIFIKR